MKTSYILEHKISFKHLTFRNRGNIFYENGIERRRSEDS